MLQNIRDNAQGTIAKIIVGLIVVTFALFGVESIVGSLSGEPEVASVNGEGITELEFQQQLERNRRQLISQMGENYDPSLIDENRLRQTTLDQAIAGEVQRQAAESKGLAVAEATIDQFILNWPPAQIDGQFNRERFQQVLRNIGLSPLAFRNELRKELMVGQIRNAITQTSIVLDEEVADLLRIERQQRSFRYMRLDAESLVENIDIDPGSVGTYYSDNQAEFELPDRVRLDYIEVSKADLVDKVTVDEDEVRARHEEEIADFTAEEQRRASHILVEITDELPEEEALQKAQSLKERIDAGEDFAELAKTESSDIGSANRGGDLGLANKGTFVGPFEDKLFSMTEGQISDPVKTEFGFHIIKLDEISKIEPPSFEESSERIRAEIRLAKAEDLFIGYSSKLADLTYSAPDLSEAAIELEISVKTSSAIPRSGGSGIFNNPAILNQAFSVEVLEDGHNSDVVEIGRDTLVVVRKNEFLPSQVQPLEDVEGQIRQKLALAEAKKQLIENAETLIAQAEQANFEDFEGQAWAVAENVSRNQPEHGDAVQFAFRMGDPGEGIIANKFETSDGYLIIALTELVEEQQEFSDAEQQTFRSFLSNQVGAREFNNFNSKLQKLAEIERI